MLSTKTDITYVDIYNYGRDRIWMSTEYVQNYELLYVHMCRWATASFLWIPEIPIDYQNQLIMNYLHLDN